MYIYIHKQDLPLNNQLWLIASLKRGKTPNKCPGYDTMQSDCKAVRMQSTPSLS